MQYSANAEKKIKIFKILLRNNPPCGFGLSPRSRDQPQPGSLFSRSWGRGERDPGNEVAQTEVDNYFLCPVKAKEMN